MRSLVFLVVLALGGGLVRGQEPAPDAPHVPGRLLVGHAADLDPETMSRTVLAHGGALHKRGKAGFSVLRVNEKNIRATWKSLQQSGMFTFVEPDYLAEAAAAPNDPSFLSQWYLTKIQAPAAWDAGSAGSSGVTVAVIDSGADASHPDLAGRLVPGWSFVSGTSNTADVYGHGTAVAGVVGAAANNGVGIAGATWASPVMPLVAIDSTGYASYSNIANAIRYAADRGVRIINISIGGTSSSYTLQSAVDYAWSKGAVVFASAMNNSTSAKYYPAACNRVVAVSSTDSNDLLSGFSNYGSWITLAAPGTSILTTNRGGGYGYWSGTSFASPLAASAGALALAVKPSLTAAELVELLQSSTDDLGTPGFDNSFGWGRINARQAVTAAGGSAVSVTVTPASSTLNASQNLQLTATVTGGASSNVTWSLNPAVGSVSAAGLYAAPASVAAAQTVTVTATSVADPSKSANAVITVNPPPATLASLSASAATLASGSSFSLTAVLTAAAPSGGTAVTFSSSLPAVVAVPASGTIAAGTLQASFNATTGTVASATTVTITAAGGGVTRTVSVTVNPPAALASLSASVTSVTAGSAVSLSAALTAAAPQGGAPVTFSSSHPAVLSVAASASIAAGNTQGQFTAGSGSVASPTAVTITASAGGASRSVSVTVNPAATLASLSAPVSSLSGGSALSLTTSLTAAAPAGGVAVTFSSSHPSVIAVPAGVTIAAGTAQAGINAASSTVASPTAVTITASAAGLTRSVTVTVEPAPTVYLIRIDPGTDAVVGGRSRPYRVTLNTTAVSDITVLLSSSAPSAVQVPASVVVPAGATYAVFNLNTAPVAGNTPVTISASAAGFVRSCVLTVTAPKVRALVVSQTSARGGTSLAWNKVYLDGAAPAGGVIVTLTSSNGAVASVSNVTIPAGAGESYFTITTGTVTETSTATVTATLRGSQSVVVTVNP